MTLNDLYRATLEKLTVVAAGEPADAGDLAVIATRYASVYNMLAGLRLVSWAADEPVPDSAALPLTSMLAFASARDFGKNSDAFALEGAIGISPPSLAERQLRQQLARAYVSQPVKTVYF